MTNLTFNLEYRNPSTDELESNPAPGATWRGNEPVGMVSGSYSHRVMGSSNDGGPWWAVGTPYTIVATTSIYDDGNGTAIRGIYPAGLPGGEDSPSVTGYSWAGSREVYLTFPWKVSANWSGHPTGTNKIVYISTTSTGANPAFVSYQTDLSPPQISLRNQGMVVGVDMTPNLAVVGVAAGEEALVEIHLKCNSAAGVADGEAHLWINGIKTSQFTGLNWNASDFNFNQIAFDSIWGGGGSTVPAEMYIECPRAWLSLKS